MEVRGPHTLIFDVISNSTEKDVPLLLLGETHHREVEQLNVHHILETICRKQPQTMLYIERYKAPLKIRPAAVINVSMNGCYEQNKVYVDLKNFDPEFNRALFHPMQRSSQEVTAHRSKLSLWMKAVYANHKSEAIRLCDEIFGEEIPYAREFTNMITAKLASIVHTSADSFDVVTNEFESSIVLGYHPKDDDRKGSNDLDQYTVEGANIFAVCILQDLYTLGLMIESKKPSIFYGGSTHVWQMQWLLENFYKVTPSRVYFHHEKNESYSCNLSLRIFGLITSKFASF